MKKLLLPIITLTIVLLFSNCEKDEPQPDYVGKWTTYHDGRIYLDSIRYLELSIKQVYTLEKSSYTETFQIQYSDGNYYTEEVFKGDLSVTDDNMDFEVTSYGMPGRDELTGLPLSEIYFYEKKDPVFSNNVEEISYSEKFQVDVENKALYFLRDIDLDGTYSLSEALKFLKE